MKVLMASSPGHPRRANEDFVGAVPGAVVLLDGAGIPGTESLCHHGVAWYARTLGATLLERLSRAGEPGLVVALADSLQHVAGLHRDTCDLANPSSPQATVAMIRFGEDSVDYLALADAFVVVDVAASAPLVVTDAREVDVRRECTSAMRGLPTGTPEYVRERRSAIDALRARRNQPGGYWIAKEDPAAAMEAVTGSVSLDQVNGLALLSNGASRAVADYRLATWAAVLDLARSQGPEEVLRRVREAESGAPSTSAVAGIHEPDDATIAYCEPSRGRETGE